MSHKTQTGVATEWLRVAVQVETDECQLWPFRRTETGRGEMSWKGRTRLVHHVALILVDREPPRAPLETRHTCGNGHLGCVNPRHLIEGTHAENIADKVDHGTIQRGERAPTSKLSEAQVLEIRAATGTHREIAARYGICRETVGQLRRRTSWAWL